MKLQQKGMKLQKQTLLQKHTLLQKQRTLQHQQTPQKGNYLTLEVGKHWISYLHLFAIVLRTYSQWGNFKGSTVNFNPISINSKKWAYSRNHYDTNIKLYNNNYHNYHNKKNADNYYEFKRFLEKYQI